MMIRSSHPTNMSYRRPRDTSKVLPLQLFRACYSSTRRGFHGSDEDRVLSREGRVKAFDGHRASCRHYISVEDRGAVDTSCLRNRWLPP
eukprot:scaffold154165_cov32-Tisochrysis_lutea.AAC.2